MAALGRRSGSTLVSHLMKSLTGLSNSRSLSDIANTEVITTHTAKWMQVLGLTNINIKYKLKLVNNLQGNPSDLEEWRLMGNEERIDRVKMYTECNIPCPLKIP